MNNHNKNKINYDINNKNHHIYSLIFPTITELNEFNPNKNNKFIQNNEYKIEPKKIIEGNSNHIFKKINKRSKSYANLIGKKLDQNKQKISNMKNFKRNNIPYYGFLNMNEINKLNRLNNSKNNLLYNNIIKTFNNTKALHSNNNNKLTYKEIKTYDNNKSINSIKNDIISCRKQIFDLSLPDKKQILKYNNSCIFQNFLRLGNINYMIKNKSGYIGSCFACYLGCSISKSGYSPMTYSPYIPMKKKRNEITEMPKNIVYEQYTKHQKI